MITTNSPTTFQPANHAPSSSSRSTLNRTPETPKTAARPGHIRRRLGALATIAVLIGGSSALTIGLPSRANAQPVVQRTVILDVARWEVPAGVTSLLVEAVGGSGESGVTHTLEGKGGVGGFGARVYATIPVTPGERLQIIPGFTGGKISIDEWARRFAGGHGGDAPYASGYGGSGSAVARENGTELVVAGGGGGGGAHWYANGGGGGNGGGYQGTAGDDSGAGAGGVGTTASGRGAEGERSGFSGKGGGGGGGYRGGVGGHHGDVFKPGGGGAGGSNYAVSPMIEQIRGDYGDGYIALSWSPILPTKGLLTASANPVVLAQPLSFTLALSWDQALAAGYPAPTGKVYYGTYNTDNRVEDTIGYVDLDPASNGLATLIMPGFPVGYTAIWASYSGDANHAPYKTGYYNQQTIAIDRSFTLSPSTVSFGSQAVGSTTTQQVTVTNAGNVVWSLGLIDGDNPNFGYTADTCSPPAVVAPGASCTFSAFFKPSAPGATTGHFGIRDAADNRAVVTMTGTGTTPEVRTYTVAPTSIEFGVIDVGTSATKSFKITNTGNVAMTWTNLGASNAAFNVPTGTCYQSATIAAGASCTLDVSFDAKTAGDQVGNVTVANSWGVAIVVPVKGSGAVKPVKTYTVDPTMLDFGAIDVGTTTTKTFKLTNSGNIALKISGIHTTDSTLFNAPSNTCFASNPLPPGASCTFDISFTATGSGVKTGTMTVDNAWGPAIAIPVKGSGVAKTFTVDPIMLDFGSIDAGTSATKTITVTNTGSVAMLATGVAPSVGSPFSALSGTCVQSATVAAGASCTFVVTFEAKTGGDKSDTLTVSTSFGPLSVGVKGFGVVKRITLAPAALAFGTQDVGSTSTQTLTLTNTGNVAFATASAATDRALFKIASSTCTTPVAPNTNCQIVVAFSPAQAGPAMATLTITDSWSRTNLVALTGAGVIARPEITGVSPAFGPKRGGTRITISGRNLVDVRRIMFGNTPATTFSCPSRTVCAVITPRGEDTVHITIVTATTSTQRTDADRFRYERNSGPSGGGGNGGWGNGGGGGQDGNDEHGHGHDE